MSRISGKAFRALSLAALGLARVVGMTLPASAVDAAGTVHSSPIGVWEGTGRHGEGTDSLILSFHAEGSVCLAVTDVPDGGKAEGKGSWQATGPDTFAYVVKEWLFDATGAVTGSVDIDQKAVRSAETFDSSGVSKIYDAQGAYGGSTEAEVSARGAVHSRTAAERAPFPPVPFPTGPLRPRGAVGTRDDPPRSRWAAARGSSRGEHVCHATTQAAPACRSSGSWPMAAMADQLPVRRPL